MTTPGAGVARAEPLRILFVSWNYPPRRGGVEEMVRQLARRLAAESELLLLTGKGRPTEPDPPWVRRSPWPGLIGFLAWLVWRLPLSSLRGRHQVILSSGALVASVVRLLARPRLRPQAALVYGTDLTYPNPLYQAWLKLWIPKLDLLLPISRAPIAELESKGLASSDRMVTLSPGVDPGMTQLPQEAWREKPSRPVLLFVGRVIPRKGLAPFIEHCLPRILERVDVELWVVGGEAEASLAHKAGELARLSEAIQGTHLESRVELLGEISDEKLRWAYTQAALLILPAVPVPGDVEGFGIVFLEAALFGLPAVSTRIGGIPEAVVDGETGSLVEPENWEAFAEEVVRLLEDDPSRRRLGESARQRALADFDWSHLARRLRQTLAELPR